MDIVTLKLIIYYGSWLVFPLLFWAIVKRRIIFAILFVLFIYARFVEPNMVVVEHHKIQTGFEARYALISDMHLGIYNDASILEKAVDKINTLDIDAVMITGDFTYKPQFDDLEKLFAPLSKLKVPIFAVLGNHDCQRPGPNIRQALEDTLKHLGVKLLNNESQNFNGITIVGVGSRWANEDSVEILKEYSPKDRVILLAHNPDSVLDISPKQYPDITLAGHTHGGQIRLPYLYKKVLPIEGEFLWDRGLHHYQKHKVFVSSGMGQVGLPLRFLVPPVVDVIELY
ncbi:MAG: metallophosphoesterase [Campylobacterota bacterium]|nr:metallophosphoesterase [Campylobacterota bacterium]